MDEQTQYKIEVLPAALSDIDYIVDYLNTLSARTAENHIDRISDGIKRLRMFPLRCPPAKNEKYAKSGYRYLVINFYLAFFTVEGDTVKIQRIFDGRSNYTAQI